MICMTCITMSYHIESITILSQNFTTHFPSNSQSSRRYRIKGSIQPIPTHSVPVPENVILDRRGGSNASDKEHPLPLEDISPLPHHSPRHPSSTHQFPLNFLTTLFDRPE